MIRRRLRPIVLSLSALLVAACGGEAPEARSPSPSGAPEARLRPLDPATSSGEGMTEKQNAAPEETIAAKRQPPFGERMLGRWKAKEGNVEREYEGDVEAAYENGRLVYKIRYEVLKDESGEYTLRRTGKDEVTNQEVKGEYKVVFKDDNTIEIRDPDVKDPKRSTVLVLERSMVRAKAVPQDASKSTK